MLFSPPGLFGFDSLPEHSPDLIFLQLNYRVPTWLVESTSCAVFGHKNAHVREQKVRLRINAGFIAIHL